MRNEIVIGTTFQMDGKLWKVITDSSNGWVGIECQDRNKAFACESIKDIQKYLSGQSDDT